MTRLGLSNGIEQPEAAASLKASTLMQKLQRFAAEAILSNPVINPAATGATLTTATTPILSTTLAAILAQITPPKFRFHGGEPQNQGVGTFLRCASATNEGTTLLFAGGYRVDFMVDSAGFDIITSGSATKIRFFVNDRVVNVAGTVGAQTTAGLLNYWNLDFSGARDTRKITVEMSQNVGFGGVRIGVNDRVWKPSDDDVVHVGIFSDSYGQGTGFSSTQAAAVSHIMSQLLFGGGVNTIPIGVGGTGYIADNAGASTPAINRVSDWSLPSKPIDLAIIALGYNDKALTAAAITAAALAFFKASRARLPTQPIVVLGPWYGITNGSALILACEDAILAAFTQWGDPNSVFVPLQRAASPWIKGDGFAGSTTGNGNSDIYILSDAVHPNGDAGHIAHGRGAANDIRKALLS